MNTLENQGEEKSQSDSSNTIELEKTQTNEEKQGDTLVTEEGVQQQEVIEENKANLEKDEKPEKKNKIKRFSISLKKFFYAIIVLIIIALVIIGSLWGPKIYKNFNLFSNKYGFDYNFNKVKNHDWDSVLTEKKIAQALNVSPQKINTVKNPDYSWALEAPDQLVSQIICASLLEEKVLYELSDSNNNLFTVSIMLCKDTAKSKELFTTRENNLQLLVTQDETLKLKTIGQPKEIGEDAYNYILEKKAKIEANPEDPESKPQETTELYSGLIYLRGPFIVRIEESQKDDLTILADENLRANLAKQIDKEIKGTLSMF